MTCWKENMCKSKLGIISPNREPSFRFDISKLFFMKQFIKKYQHHLACTWSTHLNHSFEQDESKFKMDQHIIYSCSSSLNFVV